MDIALPLDKMTAAEKIRAMEAIWDDLCKSAGDLESPTWSGAGRYRAGELR